MDRRRSGLIETFAEQYEALLRFLTRRTGSAEKAADIAQETYLRLVVAGEAASEIGNPRAYVFRVAGNIAVDSMRRDRRIERRTAPAAEAARTPDPAASPERALFDRERLAMLDAALRDLAPAQRRALLMSRVEGRTFAEIAVILGVSESMVAKYIAHALRACRARLRRADEEI